MSQPDNQIRVKELIKALYEELKVENLDLMEDERSLLVELIACDIILREGYLPHFDLPIINQWCH